MSKPLDKTTIKYIALSAGVKPKKDPETGKDEMDESIYALVRAIERHHNIGEDNADCKTI